MVFRTDDGRLETILCGRDNPIRWSLAKGTPAPGETMEQTALREVREETGLEVRIEEPICSIDYWFAARDSDVCHHKTVHFYVMTPIGGDIDLHDPEFDIVAREGIRHSTAFTVRSISRSLAHWTSRVPKPNLDGLSPRQTFSHRGQFMARVSPPCSCLVTLAWSTITGTPPCKHWVQ